MKIRMRLVGLGLVGFTIAGAAPPPTQGYAPPRFMEAAEVRRRNVDAVRSEIDALFANFAAERNIPGLAYGIVLDGQLVHAGATGFANIERRTPATPDTRFRIASMTKSFTALAVLKLRDAGRLALHDPVETFLPEFRHVRPLTSDSPPVTIRHLLTMTPGFPEDNPWGDRQLAVSVEDLRAFVGGGFSWSNAPGVTFEYSNFAYALLGQIITVVAKQPYQRYITREILEPLGLKDTRWEFSDVPAEKLALGYRWERDAWQIEPMLHDGTYGAMGGLLTTIPDFARYVSLHLAAWPPRDDDDGGIIRRATLREMHRPAEVSTVIASQEQLAGDTAPLVMGYGYGLRWTLDGKNVGTVGHSGGLPGFGSNYRFYPQHGFAVISFSNLTYARMSLINARIGALLIGKAGLARRTVPPSPVLAERARQIADLVQTWDAALAENVVAENFFLDRSRDEWARRSRETLAQAGRISSVGAIVAENQLRGTFPLVGEHGRVEVYFTLTPEHTPRLQELKLTFVKAP